jgi:glutamate dehydrogenase/leucine dehydrogenase
LNLEFQGGLKKKELIGMNSEKLFERSLQRLGIYPLVCKVEHPEIGPLGFLVINSSVHRRAVGGIRLSPSLTLEETAGLARAMTYKFGFLNMPCGGAKAGIISSPDWSDSRKMELSQYFGAAIAPLIHNRVYTPGQDLGVGSIELWDILHGAGIAKGERPHGHIRKGTASSGDTTGITVFVAAKSAMEHLGIEMKGATVAIQGFGKVGSSVARNFHQAGAKIIAISSVEGAIYNKNGLDVEEVIKLWEEIGDRVVSKYKKCEPITHEYLLELPVDVLVPAATIWAINSENVDKLKCRIISSGANCSIHPEARERLLQKNEIVIIPDFVANCGGVLGANLYAQQKTKINMLYVNFGQMMSDLFKASEVMERSVDQLAHEIAEQNILSMQKDRKKAIHEANRLDFIYRTRRYIRGQFADKVAKLYVKKWLPEYSNIAKK